MKSKAIFFILMAALLVGAIFFPAPAVNSATPTPTQTGACIANALVLTDGNLEVLRADILAQGGCVVHLFPPHALMGRIIRRVPGATIIRGEADVTRVQSSHGAEAALAAAIWNANKIHPQAPVAPSDTARPLIGDVIHLPEVQALINAQPEQATPGIYDASEFMAGRIVVGIILPESNGLQEPSTENWDLPRIIQVVSEIQDGMDWWNMTNPQGNLEFVYDIHNQVSSDYEPINWGWPSDNLWISDTLGKLGYASGDWVARTYAYLNAIRTANAADWAVVIFVADSLKDADGIFNNGQYFGYTYGDPPLVVMTYDNDGWGIGNMNSVTAHEFGHDFGAGDEYCSPGYACCSCSERLGYLGVYNDNCEAGCYGTPNGCSTCRQVNCLMRQGNINSGLCPVSAAQVGMRDTDGDGLWDPVDTFAQFALTIQPPDLVTSPAVTYAGSAEDSPCPSPTGPVMTINTLVSFRYQLDAGDWVTIPAADGTFDETDEEFSVTIANIEDGDHVLKLEVVNRWGNRTEWADAFTVELPIKKLHLPLIQR
jgi:hypothetical protein